MKHYILIGLSLLISTMINAQNIQSKKVIDSTMQQQWQQHTLTVDSLDHLNLKALNTYPVDTILSPSLLTVEVNQEDTPVTPYHFLKMNSPKKWFFWGQNELVFNQSSFSNWNAGGNNSIGVITKVNYNISYKKDRHFWENVIRMGYGLVSSEGQSTRKTEDYLNITSNYGYDIGKNYYLSIGVQLLTQFMPGYNYKATPDPTIEDRVSRFMAPGYFNAGIGISYNPNENFQAVFRPLNAKVTIVLDEQLQKAGRYGLERDGQSVRAELGAMGSLLYRFNIIKNVQFINQLSLFSSYLNRFKWIDFNYNGALNFKLNKFISTNVNVNLLYDHDQIDKLQMKQTLGIGFSYHIGTNEKKKDSKSGKIIKPFVLEKYK
ncbi:DUF3078 domain-containing protein [Riemerella columbina]|uniref:DUF3078 domain-containing protein n=1 Tax=Riemerella columbina TaxID=103810 RepID=UPI000374322A|nr:DUF3078 domain-containing protein [Riemerella columbina]